MSDELSAVIRQGQILQQMAHDIVAKVDIPWVSLTFRAKRTAPYGERETWVTKADGTVELDDPPREIGDAIRELRDVMYRPGSGTWFTMWIDIDDTGKVSTRFDYDNEPEWDQPADPLIYFEDLQRYPRDPRHTPPWLAERVALGTDFDRHHHETDNDVEGIDTSSTEQKWQLVEELAMAVRGEVNQDWSMLWYEVNAIADHLEDLTTVVNSASDREQQIPSPPHNLESATRLRQLMYEPGRGAWFSATVTVVHPDEVDAVFNYTDEPKWTNPIDPLLYRRDLDTFPRDDSEIPDWLAAGGSLS